MTHLPGTVHLIAEAPILDLPRGFASILFSQTRHRRIFGRVTVLYPLLCIRPRSSTQIRADIGLGAKLCRVIQELMGAEAVAFHGAPGHLQPRWTFVAG